MTTKVITQEETERLFQVLALDGLPEIVELLRPAHLRIVNAPEIGCMPIFREHICQIDAPLAEYERLNALPTENKEGLLQALKKMFEAGDTELNLIEVDFYRQD